MGDDVLTDGVKLVISAVIGAGGVGGLIKFLGARQVGQLDETLRELKVTLEHLQKTLAEQHTQIQVMRVEVNRCVAELDKFRDRLHALSNQVTLMTARERKVELIE